MEIAVISGKGGSGKSSISAAFMSLFPQVVAIDCDVDASNLYLLFQPHNEKTFSFVTGRHAVVNSDNCISCGKCFSLCRFDAIKIEKAAVIDEINCDGCGLCARFCPVNAISMKAVDKSMIYIGTFRYGIMIYGRLAPGEENSGKMVSELRRLSSEIVKGKESIIVLDGPPGIGCPVMSTITGVDKVIVVTEPTLSGFSDLSRTIDLVRSRQLPVYVIINKCSLNKRISNEINRWCNQESIPVIASLPFDRQMIDALVAGKTIVEYNPNSEIAKSLKKALSDMIN